MLTPHDQACARLILERRLAPPDRLEEALAVLERARAAGLPTDLPYVCRQIGLLTDAEAAEVVAAAGTAAGAAAGPPLALPKPDAAPSSAPDATRPAHPASLLFPLATPATLSALPGSVSADGGPATTPAVDSGSRAPLCPRPTPIATPAGARTLGDSAATRLPQLLAAVAAADAAAVSSASTPGTLTPGLASEAAPVPAGTPGTLTPLFSPAPAAAPRFEGGLRTVAEYTLVRELGRGGMGVVYEAVQKSLNRRVALKVLKADDLHPQAVERFRREAENVARLNHKHIVRVYGAGCADGVYYYAMEYLEGRSVVDLMHEGSIPPYRAASLIAQAADALHFAHQNGIVHRDIKPANLMLDRDGNLVLTDFGLARNESAQTLTASGQVFGTPLYMPPEQAEGKVSEIDARSDVYALGATLYEMLARRPLFVADDVQGLLKKVIFEEAQSFRATAPGVPRDLETIALRCLRKDKSHRYPDALELKEDLERFLRGEPIKAKRVTLAERAWLLVRRHPIATAAATLALGVIAFLSVTYLESRRYFQDLAQAKELLRKGERAAANALYEELIARHPRWPDAWLSRGQGRLRDRQFADAIRDFDRVLELDPRSAQARTERAAAYAGSGRLEQAIDECGAVLDADPGFVAARLARGDGRAELGRLDEAAADFAACRDAPHPEERARALAGSADLLCERLEVAAALAAADQALATAPGLPRAVLARARALRLAGRLGEAAALLPALEAAEETRIPGRIERLWGALFALEGVDDVRHLAEALAELDRLPSPDMYALWGRSRLALAPPAALPVLQRAGERGERYPRLLGERARLELEAGQFDAAGQHADAALAIAPAWAPALLVKDRLLARTDPAGAVTALTPLLAREPNLAAAWTARGQAHLALRHETEARADLERARQLLRAGPGVASLLLARVRARVESVWTTALLFSPFVEDRMIGAVTVLDAVLFLEPEAAEARLWRARALMLLRRIPEAEAELDRAVALDPFEPELYRERVLLRLDDGQPLDGAKALAEAEQAVALAPDAPWSWDLRALVRLAGPTPDPAAALADLDRALALPHATAVLLRHRGDALDKAGDAEAAHAARARWEKAPPDPERARMYLARARAYRALPREQAFARRFLGRAEAENPNDAAVWRERFDVVITGGNYVQAIPEFVRATDLNPNIAIQFHGWVARHLRGKKLELQFFAGLGGRFAQEQPTVATAKLLPAFLLYAAGSYDDSIKWIDQALKQREAFPLAQALRGMALVRKGELVEAERWVGRALAADPDLGMGHFALACVCAQDRSRDRKPEALEHLARALQLGFGDWTDEVRAEKDLAPLAGEKRFDELLGPP